MTQSLQFLLHPQRPDWITRKAIRMFTHQLPILMAPNIRNPNYLYIFLSIQSSHMGKTSALKQKRGVSEHFLRQLKLGGFLVVSQRINHYLTFSLLGEILTIPKV